MSPDKDKTMKNLKTFIVTFLISLPFWWGINFLQQKTEDYFYAQISQPFENMVSIPVPKKNLKSPLELNAKSAISLLVDSRGREKILFQKNPEEILPIASLTKLMTAVIVLENENYDLEETFITISQNAANQEDVPQYGNLKKGEKFRVKKLLELMLIYSSNDAAFALSEVMGVENFVEKMNQKASELGLKNTHFVNPTGLDPEDLNLRQETLNYFNYSTAKDLIKLVRYILENHPLIFEISRQKGPYLINNGLSDLILPENLILIGGKTGYTDEAGGSMISVFKNEKGIIFFNIILGTESRATRIIEMQKLINWLTS